MPVDMAPVHAIWQTLTRNAYEAYREELRESFIRPACKSAVDAVDDIHRTAYAEMIAQTTPDPADQQS